MAKSVNKVILLGHLGRDPEPHTTPGGRLVVNFTVATNRTRRDADGNQVEETEWFRVAVWDQLAQMAEQFLRKGAKIYLEGRLQTRRYVDRDNVERAVVEIVAGDFVMLDRRPDDGDAPRASGPVAPPPFPQPLPVQPARPAPPAAPPSSRATPRLAALPPPVVAPQPPSPPIAWLPPQQTGLTPAPRAHAAAHEEAYAVYDIDDEDAPF